MPQRAPYNAPPVDDWAAVDDDQWSPVDTGDDWSAVDDEEDPSGGNRWGDWVGTGLRGLSGFVSNAGGFVGAAAAGAGDYLAQQIEMFGGSRKKYSPLETAAAGGVGAIPFGKAGKALWGVLKGAGLGAGGSVASDAAQQIDRIASREQDSFDLGEAGNAATFGGLVGAGGAGVGALAQKFLGGKWGASQAARRALREEADNARLPGRRALEEPLPTAGADPGGGGEYDFGEYSPQERSRRAQIEGLDPASFPRGTQEPQLRQPNNVREGSDLFGDAPETLDINELGSTPRLPWQSPRGIVRNSADIAGELDPLPGPTNQGRVDGPGPGRRPPSFLRRPGRDLPSMTEGGGEPLDVLGSGHPQSDAGQQSFPLHFDEDPMVEFERGQHRKTLDAMQDLRDMLAREGKYAPQPETPSLSLREDGPTTLNASGESAASAEAMSRSTGMRDRGEQFVVFDRAGQKKVVGAGVDAVDYVARDGETFGIEKADGSFQKLDDRGGRVPQPTQAAPRGDLYESAKAGGRMYLPAEIMALHRELGPEWAAKAGNPEDLLPFAKRILSADNDRKLMGRERKAIRSARERGKAGAPGEGAPTDRHSLLGQEDAGAFPAKADVAEDESLTQMISKLFGDEGGGPEGLTRLIGDESGSIDPELMGKLGLHAGTGVGSSLAAGALSDDENRTRNMIGAGVVGAAAPLAVTNPQALRKFRYFSMLGSTGAQAKNLVGNAGAVLVKAGEEALSGKTDSAKRILSEVFSSDTAARVVDAFKNAPEADTRWGKNTGVLGTFSRIMHAVDEAATEGLERGGVSNDEARLALHTSDPKSKWGKYISSRPEGAMDVLMPFVRTGTNLVERGLEHTPGVGMLPTVRGWRDSSDSQVMSRQAMGALAMLLGGTVGADNPYIGAALGPLAIPFSAGAAARKGYEKKGDDFSNILRAEADVIKNALPIPTDAYDYDIGKLLASFVPGVLRDASQVKPTSLDTSGSVFNPAIAKVPFLNERMLKRKRKRSRSN